MDIFNMNKLPEYTEDFASAKIVVAGGGAVGSRVVENSVKMGIEDITIIDFDPLEAENISKSSSLYRYPDDVGKNKAVALAERANELLGKNTVNGIDANITMFGPMAFAGYDAILAPFDNYAAKIYINQLWKQIPQNVRPELIFGGTFNENAQSNSLDGNGPCLRCLLAEKWLQNPLTRTSCVGPQYRNEEQLQEIVKTTGLASSNSANYMVEQLRSRLLGIKEATNKRIMYKPFPVMELNVVTPMSRNNCPDCKNYHPPKSLAKLENCSILSLTMRELLLRLNAFFGTEEYEIAIPKIEYAKVSYDELIIDDYCRACGKGLKNIYKHEFRTKYSDMLCSKCSSDNRKANDSFRKTHFGTSKNVLTPQNCTGELLDKTLFSLGWVLGGFIVVSVRNNACIDIMDPDYRKKYTFYCENDAKMMKTISTLEG